MGGVLIEEMSPGPRPVEMLDMGMLAVVGRFARAAPARMRRVEDVVASGLPEGPVAAGLRAFFALGGKEALYLPSPDLSPPPLPADSGLVAVPEAAGDWAVLAPFAAAAAEAGAMLLVDAPAVARSAAALQQWRARGGADWADAAAFAPWLVQTDGGLVPPSLAAAGVLARSERVRGVWKAPAGTEAMVDPLRNAASFGNAEQQLLNPVGVNLFRSFSGRGNLLWGARTLSADGERKYISVQRTMRMVERSLSRALAWTVFEPNGEPLWAMVRAQCEGFLDMLFRMGALQGQSAREAWFVRCDRSTMTQADVQAGRLIVQVGMALLRPAEFLVLLVHQPTASGGQA